MRFPTRIKGILKSTFVRFLIVGLGNTVVGLATILLLQNVFGVPYRLANVSGYVVGLLHSFFWNKLWTFGSNAWRFGEGFKFLVAFGGAFLVQFGILNLLVEALDVEVTIAQLVAVATYTLVNYSLNRYWTFTYD